MNYFSFNGNICYIRNDEIDIKVEIPSSLIDNFIKFPILNYFNKKGIYKVSIEKYNIYSKEEVENADKKMKEKGNSLKKKSSIMIKNKTNKMKILEEEKKLEEFLKTKESLYLIDNDIYVNYQEKENKKFPIIKQYNNFFEISDIPSFKNIKNDLLFNFTEIPRETDSNIQIVCNYLYLLKNNLLNQQNIFIFDSFKETNVNLNLLKNTKVTPEYINYLKKNKNEFIYKKVLLETTILKSISKEKYRELLKEYFVKENITFDEKPEVEE